MAYIKRRITKTGTVSTALVEAYRDEQGRPRQRLLASLRGEPDTLRALARLTMQRMKLLTKRDELANGKATDDEGDVIDAATARKVIAVIDSELAALEKHCTARKSGPQQKPTDQRSITP
jgi:hypothetical protein